MRPVLVVVAVVALAVASCGTEDAQDQAAGTGLDGRAFLSQAVEGRTLVPGTEIRLTFDDGQVGAQAGCNSMGGTYEVVDDRLVVADGLSTTEMGCEPPRHEQDAWLADLLQARPAFDLDGDELVLSTDEVTVRLLDRTVADPDRPLTGTRWEVDTVLTGDAASSVPGAPVVTIELDDDGTLTATSTGCTSVRVETEVDGEVLRFGDVSVDDVACPEPWATVLEVLGAGQATWANTAARLTITAGDVGVGAVAD